MKNIKKTASTSVIALRSACTLVIMALAMLMCTAGQAAEDRIHQVGKIRVLFQSEGPHIVKGEDRNENGVPDQVEDILTQVVAARLLFVEVLGFPDPFETERFCSASSLDIRIRSKEALKGNGLAFDELQSAKGRAWISIAVASSVNAASNMTPAHEFFHLIQYSTSYFKNKWYAEGTARWSERGLGVGALGPTQKIDAWPLSQEQAAAVFGMSYDASTHLWNPLAAQLDAQGVIPESEALKRLQEMKYIDGTPVLKDLNLCGWEFVRDVIVELGKIDKVAFRELGYDRWSEANQFSPQNNVYILRAVEEVVKWHQKK